jgi:hypothetical protein
MPHGCLRRIVFTRLLANGVDTRNPSAHNAIGLRIRRDCLRSADPVACYAATV